MSSHFDTIHLKVLIHDYLALIIHSMLSEYEKSKNKFYDIITSVLYVLWLFTCRAEGQAWLSKLFHVLGIHFHPLSIIGPTIFGPREKYF